MVAGAPAARLQRFLQPRSQVAPGEQCEFCSQPIPADETHGHAHVVDTSERSLRCSCRACALLFTNTGAAQGRYRTVGDRIVADPPIVLTDAQWNALEIPVGIVFFFRNSRLARTVALYPSPAGATESLLTLDAWADIVAANPPLADLSDDVEALLVRRERTRRDVRQECFIVPIDLCYALVGLLRSSWRGFDGGAEAREQISAFFDDLRERAPRGARR